MAEHIRFEEGLIGDGFSYAFGISTVDLTGNGFPDIVAMDTDVGLYWFENDGSGRFTRHVIHERAGEWLERHEIADIDGDGRPEIVSVDNKGGSLLWFEFDGDPRERRSWTHHYITDGGFPGAYDLAVADLDGDGDLDVAATNWRIGNEVAWFENRGERWVKHTIGGGHRRAAHHPGRRLRPRRQNGPAGLGSRRQSGHLVRESRRSGSQAVGEARHR